MVNLAIIPLLPLLGAVLMLLAGRRLPRAAVSIVCSGVILASFCYAAFATSNLQGGSAETIVAPWLPNFQIEWGFLLDRLSAVMVLIVTGVGFLIHVYSIGYMRQEDGYYRYFGYLNLFVFFMLLLVLANNYVLLFVGWEGVGLCSYLLIGFDFKRKSATNAGMKAFLVNRLGDAAFLLGMLLLSSYGALHFTDPHRALPALAGLLLFIGAVGKSAQFPLHVWLPDAMEGPTPVSALIHAATMVTAGVYVMVRSAALLTPDVASLIAVSGAFTAIFAASIAIVQNDIKRVLAYSTISQLGFMFMAVGVGAYNAAIFHLFTHAFFKALLFLAAGSVIHALSGEQDLRNMGGLKAKLPITHWTMLIGTLAIAGVPGFAGFFSKDEILVQAYGGSTALYVTGVITSLMTCFYMFRMLYLAFYGEPRADIGKAHESPASMTAPLGILALASIFAGWIGIPGSWTFFGDGFRAFHTWLGPGFNVPAGSEAGTEWLLILIPAAMILPGWLLARRFYLAEGSGPLYRALINKWYVDQIYNAVFVRGFALGGGAALSLFDQKVVDGGVNGAAWFTRFTSKLSIWWDIWIVDGVVNLTAATVKLASYPARFLQTGHVQSYALVFVVGVLTVFGYYLVH